MPHCGAPLTAFDVASLPHRSAKPGLLQGNRRLQQPAGRLGWLGLAPTGQGGQQAASRAEPRLAEQPSPAGARCRKACEPLQPRSPLIGHEPAEGLAGGDPFESQSLLQGMGQPGRILRGDLQQPGALQGIEHL